MLIEDLIKLSFLVELPSGAEVTVDLRITGEPDLANEVLTEGLPGIASACVFNLSAVIEE